MVVKEKKTIEGHLDEIWGNYVLMETETKRRGNRIQLPVTVGSCS